MKCSWLEKNQNEEKMNKNDKNIKIKRSFWKSNIWSGFCWKRSGQVWVKNPPYEYQFWVTRIALPVILYLFSYLTYCLYSKHCQMPNAKCQMPNAKFQMPNAKCRLYSILHLPLISSFTKSLADYVILKTQLYHYVISSYHVSCYIKQMIISISLLRYVIKSCNRSSYS